MINTQKREAVLKDKKVLEVCDVWRTIQGEGPFAGMPAVFVRLAGCNLNCPACDTDYTSNRMSIRPEQLVERIQYKQTGGLVVFTGGEPLRQNIGIATKLLYRLGYTVQIETNGMLYRDDMEYNGLTIVCSPKSPIIHEKLQPLIRAVKYVVQAGFVDVDGLPTRTLGNPWRVGRMKPCYGVETYVQPLDQQDPVLNKNNLNAALDSCFKFGYRMSIQTHKLMGVQ